MEEAIIESGSAQHKHQHPSLGIQDQDFKISENRAANEYEDDHENNGDNDGDSIDAIDVDNDRVARSRDRNREHARRTRLRKKAQLQVLHNKVKDLQDENLLLSQTIEECSIASILLNLSSGDSVDNSDVSEVNDLDDVIKKGTTDQHQKYFTSNGKRKRFISDAGDHAPPPMKLKINGLTTIVGQGSGKAHINWKTGVYLDENGQQRQLSSQELETLRRERNRMHAKMTRDRKKVFISSVEKTIEELQEDNKRMRSILAKQALDHANKSVTPEPSPMLSSRRDSPCSLNSIPLLTAAINVNPISKVVSPINATHVESSSDSQEP